MTALSFAAALILYFVDRKAEQKKLVISGLTSLFYICNGLANRRSRKIRWRDVAEFPPIYWVLCIVCSAYYINIFCMMAILTDFLEERNGYSPETARLN